MRCEKCDGAGRQPANPELECGVCQGMGTVPEPVEARELELPDDALITGGDRVRPTPKRRR